MADDTLIFDTQLDTSGLSTGLGKIGSVANATFKGMTTVLAGATTAVGALSKSALDGYADYEQLTGGIETLFKDSADVVMGYAENAYKTAGMSANEYMETVTGFSASLIQSLDGDTRKASEYANMAISDMSDNANKMGSNITDIQNAYGGFAKQNFTMLDNLKLGYGGTQEEMQRLLKDAEAISGIEYDISSYADVVEAIHIIQNEMGITGTTAREASETISGSVASTKSAWDNLIVGIADDNADLDGLINNFVDSALTALNNIIPRISQIFKGVGSLVSGLAPIISSELPALINEVLPVLLDSATVLLENLLTAIIAILPSLVTSVMDALLQLTSTLLSMTPQLIEVALQIIISIIDALAKMVPQLIIQVVDIIPQIVQALTSGIPILLDGAINFLMAIVDAVPQIVDSLMNALPQIIESILGVLTTSIPKIIDGAIKLFHSIIQAIGKIIPIIAKALPQLITTIVEGLTSALPLVLNGAVQLLTGILDAIPMIIEMLIPVIPEIVLAIILALVECTPALLEGTVQLFMAIVEAIPIIIASLIKAIPGIVVAIIEGLSKLPGEMTDIFNASSENIVNAFVAIPDNLASIFSDSWERIKSAFSSVGDFFTGIGTRIKEAFVPISDWITNNVINPIMTIFTNIINWLTKNVVNKISGIVSTLKDKFTEAVRSFTSVGKNIIDGIWNGIQDGWDWLTSKVSSLARSLYESAKSALGIASPSKKFKYLGEMCVTGFDQGIKDLMDENTLTKNINASMRTMSANTSGSGGNGINGGFHQTINVNREISTPDELARAVRIESKYGLMRGVSLVG